MSKISNPVSLYRHLLRMIKKLPTEARPYYSSYVRSSYNSHQDEDDPERIQEIIARAQEDAQWILDKYSKKQGNTDIN